MSGAPGNFICFDLNGTLITNNTWRDLNMVLGVTPTEDREIMRLCENKYVSYKQGQKKLEALYLQRGKATKKNISLQLTRFNFAPYAEEIIGYLQKRNYTIAILSNSIDILVQAVAERLKIKYFASNNSFVFDKQDRLREIRVTVEDVYFKKRQLEIWCEALSIKPSDCYFVGDDKDDRDPFNYCGHGITFKGSPIESVAWKTIGSFGDLRSIF